MNTEPITRYCLECRKLRYFRYLDCEECHGTGKECIWVCTECGAELYKGAPEDQLKSRAKDAITQYADPDNRDAISEEAWSVIEVLLSFLSFKQLEAIPERLRTGEVEE